ncbi:MAG: tetratricopeptide repeat protein [Roseburia sp.]|nr:tetratricopeptide repeat protein [Roseburia sp.]MCM1278882.1 tetratricopeptide repeat protein [Robinsoniella sp.]
MKCFNCGCSLSEKSFCTGCGIDVSLYKKIMYTSNRYYNDGLDKANVRDLSGAAVSLRQSLKFNKNHIEARNLLGLVYFEMGDVVAALSEWVISKNFRPNKNIADDYINAVQENTTRLEAIDQAARKYNKVLDYCNQGSLDLAVIQLKKVLSLTPNMLRGRQLLALLYMQSEEWEKAKRELLKCQKIDTNNTTTLRYLKETKRMLEEDVQNASPQKKKKAAAENAIVYQSGNETIIQPLNAKEPVIGSTILNLLLGLVIGLAVCWFLILPARIQAVRVGYQEELKNVGDNSDAKTATITDLEQRVSALTDENKNLQEQIESFTGSDGAMEAADSLMKAAMTYMTDDSEEAAIGDLLVQVDEEYLEGEASEAYKQLYNQLMEAVGPSIAEKYYSEGTLAVNQNDYTKAVENLEKAWYFDKTKSQTLYQLAQAYRMAGDTENASEAYKQVVDLFPGSESARKAREYLEEQQ